MSNKSRWELIDELDHEGTVTRTWAMQLDSSVYGSTTGVLIRTVTITPVHDPDYPLRLSHIVQTETNVFVPELTLGALKKGVQE